MYVSQQQQQQQQHSPQSLYSTTVNDSPQGWPPYDQTLLPQFQSQPLPYRGFPPAAPYPTPRLTSPLNIAGGGMSAANMSRLSLAGSLDPATGIFYRTPEHPRLRTAQACEKCRTRKAKVCLSQDLTIARWFANLYNVVFSIESNRLLVQR
jgi:hypothetical protein